MEKVLDEILPIMDVEHDCILSKQGDITIVFKVDLPEIFTLSDQEYEAFHQAWIKAIKLLPKFSVLHKQDWFLQSRHKPDFTKDDTSFLSRSSERFFNERPFLAHSCYIMLTKKPVGRKTASSLFSNLLRKSMVPEETLKPQLLQDFLDSAGQFKRIMDDSGFVKLTRLREKDLQSHSRKMGLVEQYCYLSERNDSFLMNDISFDEGLQVGDKRCQLYTLGDAADLPALCGSRINYDRYSTDKTKFSVGFASTLGQLLPCNHIYNQYIFIEDAQKTIQKLESKRLRLQSLSAYSRENLIARDATNDFLNEAISQQRLPVKAHFNVLVWTDDKEELKDLKNMVSSALAQMDAVAKQETVGAPQIFWAGIPGNAADFPMNDTFDTFAEQATCFLNLETSYRSSLSPVGIRMGDRLTGKPVHVDISDEPMKMGICTNRNKFILGPSGSGKSFFTNHMVRSYYEQGTHIVLVDVGHSYKGLCDMVKGYYFTYSEDNPIRFNPFYIGEGDSLDTEKKESIKTLLLALWKKDDETFRRSEYVALSNAIGGYYAHLDKHTEIFACFNSFYAFLRDEYIQVLEGDRVKEKDFDIDNFLYVLRPYYEGGEFDYLLNATENLNLLQERFIVFELDNIKDHPILFPVVTIIIMEVFINKMRKMKGLRKMILIEEAWKALMKEGFAEYIKYLFKTVRKFFGEAIVVTQEIEDIISSPVVKQAIINNSDCKILLDQSKYQNKFDQIQELLGLTEKEKALVLSVNKSNDPTKKYKEVFISLGGMLSKVYRTEVSLEEYLAYTTEQTEKVKLMEYAARFGGEIQKGIAAMADDIRSKI
ncbi:MAG: conjugal transfer protein TraG [Sphingobacteriia bacterium 24-36-13]|jgi:conjugation system TraG family ATPase|uniref:TraG family conjugative transposon ATPase n=1 Tax=Chitinophagaceae TaxID=563835 RepID=UPI0009466149|nr:MULTISPECIES: TraG family conjugative transposon ATPase [Chitinophagaceae]OYY11599.1 MAG: conjugal transfer protein TraG [Sphingobacteriia bacterium 35-36-14]OYZ55303.1 MAG: conjugal transfer protein TraG [Sphingobacteriia bacterium 24-36-13]OZA66263.1 MAG: conjugal transfer protein TraG [Sphingobacteriia bacterium 39-36-14]RWZ89412.1 MAG: TraG family conjugative transposon ATPase [Hydrotalea sp. AMD]HQS22839.1 TraG family conjugative transposon ATPase [Sediminibacterium sp.]